MYRNVLLFLLMFSPVCLHAQVLDDNRALFDRLERLERDVVLMQRRLYKNVKPAEENETENVSSRGSTEHLYAKMMESEKIAQESTAQMEELTFKVNQLSEILNALSKDVDVRFEELEKKMQDIQKPLPMPEPKKTEDITPTKTAKEAYQEAYQLLKKGNYQEAEIALKAFLEKYPEDTLAGNAQYWLGETYYVQGSYDQAAVCFAEGFKKYKDGPKGPDTLLKLGLSLEKMDKKQEACTAFRNMEKTFPKASDTVRQKAKGEIEKLSCS